MFNISLGAGEGGGVVWLEGGPGGEEGTSDPGGDIGNKSPYLPKAGSILAQALQGFTESWTRM